MSVRYYSGWFDEALPASYLESLRNDIADKKSLVLIWGCWSGDELKSAQKDLLPLSRQIEIYATSQESFIRKEGNDIAAFGDVYRISDSKMEKISAVPGR